MCFTGHRDLMGMESALSGALDTVLEALYRRGYRRFLSGGARGFDLLAAERVLALRSVHPEVTLVMVVPCAEQTKGWPEAMCRQYERVLLAADENRVLSLKYYSGCMMVRNRHMVDRASACVCFLCKPKGGTMSTAAYASRSGLLMLNLAIEKVCDAYVRETAALCDKV